MTDKFYKLIIAYNQQYPNKEVTMWLLYSYGTEDAIKTIQNRDGRKIGVKEIKDGFSNLYCEVTSIVLYGDTS